MPRLKILYEQTTKRVTQEQAYRRPTTDPFIRNLKIREYLRSPTWSVKSLLQQPSPSTATTPTPNSNSQITPKELHHLLRLSALPQPKTQSQETEMLKTLQTQLQFVQEIQKVDTDGVEPLVGIRDETEEGKREDTVTLEDLRGEIGSDLDAEMREVERVRSRGSLGEMLRRGKGPGWVDHRDRRGDGGGGGSSSTLSAGRNTDIFTMAGSGKTMGRYFVVRRRRARNEGEKAIR